MRFLALLAFATINFLIIPAAAMTCREPALEKESGSARAQAMAGEIAAYQRLVEEALSLRAQAIRFHQGLQDKLTAGGHLSGEDLQILNAGATALLSQREALLKVAETYECWVKAPPSEIPQQAAIQIAGVTMSLSAALVLFDNYLFAVAPYRNDHRLRQHFNRKDKGFEIQTGTLNKMAQQFASGETRQRVRRAILWVEQYGDNATVDIEGHAYLRALLEQSPSLSMLRKVAPLRNLVEQIDFFGALTIDTIFGLKNEGTHVSSLLFGNTIGLVETRRGKLYRRPEVLERVKSTLQAGDILLEKTPFRLTDTFIPGHWGHAAVWIGSETELRALGIWEHPVTRKHHEAIRAGRSVVEALRSGVEINPIEHFMNIDDLGVLRHTSLPRQKRAEVILQALRQVGKPYDFNFDAQTTHRVFCSKLVYLAYGDLQWPTSRMLGRVTVSPDNIAARALDDGPLTVSLLYHDGQEISEGRHELMEKLMRQRQALVLSEKAD